MQNNYKFMKSYRGLPKDIYIIFFATIINSLGAFVFPLLSLILTQKVGLNGAEAGFFVTILALAKMPSLLIGGKVSDTIGRKKTILIFQSLGAICYIVCGFVKPSIFLAVIIVIASCFYGMASPSCEALTADLTDTKNRKGAFSLIYMGMNIGFAVAPVLGGVLFQDHLNVLFILDGISTVLSLVLIMFFVNETKKQEDTLKIIENNHENNTTGSVFKVLIKRPVLLYFAGIMFIYQFAYSQWSFTLPLEMTQVFGTQGAKLYGIVVGFNAVVVILFTPMITLLVRKTSPVKSMALGGFFYAIAFFMLGLFNQYFMYFVAIFILTLGEILISINSGTFIANNSPTSHRGRINSIIPIITGAGFSLGPAVMGIVVTKLGYLTSFIITAMLVFVGSLLMSVLDKKANQT